LWYDRYAVWNGECCIESHVRRDARCLPPRNPYQTHTKRKPPANSAWHNAFIVDACMAILGAVETELTLREAARRIQRTRNPDPTLTERRIGFASRMHKGVQRQALMRSRAPSNGESPSG
jgi:hypothetical protein